MVKNLSNPLNARKLAQILANDIQQAGYSTQQRDISVYLSDHRISDFQTALNQLKQEDIIPEDYMVSDSCRDTLIEADFIEDSIQISQQNTMSAELGLELLGDLNDINSIEFNTQLESLKSKLMTSWSGGLSIDGHELDNFDRKFGKPMTSFKDFMAEQGAEISDLQAFAVVYATDHLSLGDNSKEEVFHLMFGRFDENQSELEEKYSFKYSWPVISGTSFIEMGKRFTIGPELAEFAKRFRGISGLDTYPDEVIQVFFFNLISGPLIDEMIDKHILFRWADETTDTSDPYRWLLPPPDFSVALQLREFLVQTVITHTLLTRIDPQTPSLMTLLEEGEAMDSGQRCAYLAKKIEATLTRKSVALQFGTTLANFFENFKTNPSAVTPFLDTTFRYFTKSEHIQTVIDTMEHSIRTALKNSTGIIKEYLRNIGDEDLVATIRANVEAGITYGIEHVLDEFKDEFVTGKIIDYNQLDAKLRTLDDEVVKSFFLKVLDQAFVHTNRYAKSLEPQTQEPVSSEGGLTELTQDFLSTAKYHGSKNWQTKTMIADLVDGGLQADIAEKICHICSYITYQIASMEGSNGEKMLKSLISQYEKKAHELGRIPLGDTSSLRNDPSFAEFILEDLRQAHVLVSLPSKTKTDVYNAWTPLDSGSAKHTRFLNEIVIPNLYYWQRLPREFVMDLVESGKLAKSAIKDVVTATNRLSLLEAYQLLVLGSRPDINTLEAANKYLRDLFGIKGDLSDAFKLSPRSGEAEIALETIHIWSDLQEVTV